MSRPCGGLLKMENHTGLCRLMYAELQAKLLTVGCLCLSKDERVTTPLKKKGSAAAREPSKRGRESQKAKRRSRISSLSTCSESSQVNNQATLEQKRQQRFAGGWRGGGRRPRGACWVD